MALKAMVISVVIWSLLLAACSGVEVSTEKSPEVPLANEKTFQWYQTQQEQLGPENPGFNWIFDAKIRNAIESELAALGIKPAKEGQSPDFLISYYKAIHDRTSISSDGMTMGMGWGYYPGYMGYSVPYVRSYQYRLGMLTIDFIDPQTRKNFWRGTVSAEVEDPTTNYRHFSEGIKEMVHRFDQMRKREVAEGG